jgi:outer membrane protein insertion porin family
MQLRWYGQLLFAVICSSSVTLFCVIASQQKFQELEQFFVGEQSASFSISKVTFTSDISMSKSEFQYLTDLRSGMMLTENFYKKAHSRLQGKNRFHTIKFFVVDYQKGKRVHVDLKAYWMLHALIIRGIIFGRRHFIDIYQQQPGDRFDISLHEESIKNMRSYLHDTGYFKAEIKSELLYDQVNKTITPKIVIYKGKRFTIKKAFIEIEEGARILDNELAKTLESNVISDLVGHNFSKKLINKSVEKIKKVLRKKGFVEYKVRVTRVLEIDKARVNVKFLIKLGKQASCRFVGNRLFTDKQLHARIKGIKQPSWLFIPEIIAEQIVHAYYKKGYRNTRVHFKKEADGSYLFTIREGQPVRIMDVTVVVDGEKIPDHRSHFEDLLKKGVFDEDRFRQCLEKLKVWHIRQGFLDVLVRNINYERKDDAYVVTIKLEKGLQRFIGSISLQGVQEKHACEFFRKFVDAKKDILKVVDPYWLQEQRKFLLHFFQQQEYWYVTVQPCMQSKVVSQPGDEKQKIIVVSLTWDITLGQKVTFGKVLVQGDTKVPFDVIFSTIPFKQGDEWDRRKLDLARSRLKKLSIFKHIQLQPYQMATRSGTKDVILTLRDDDPLQLHLRAGYFLTSKNFWFQRDSTYKIGGSLIVKNPTNAADNLLLAADLTRFERKLSFDYQCPRLFGWPLISRFKMYGNKYVHPLAVGKSDVAYEALQSGILLGISNEYKKDYYWGLTFGNEWMKTSRIRGDIRLANSMINKMLPFFFLEPSLVVDRVDDRLDPSRGTLTFLSLKIMIPEKSGDLTYRFMIEHAFYYRLFHKILLAMRVRFGHIFRREFEKIMPIERFYLGGPHSVRGYDKDAVPPLSVTQVVDEDGESKQEVTIQGGSSMFNFTSELRFPVYRSFGGVVFQDIGVLSQSGISPFAEKWFPTTGFGLRYQTPIGALRFDVGWKWKKVFSDESSSVWYLTLGHMF